ncbi:hypothetical protein [Burkholderia sp. Ac-20365]|uniref:hypothetical protein n=1 Tax=Burkholderia sp. Ac-20365 TaxID=2703897 RepID=UPI00197BC30A|nr:hypothetical protein [Burkholderia sp. Ac-20365]MBN3761082.1 hypothetical protein [Burkholderia sp. Ac-20365]
MSSSIEVVTTSSVARPIQLPTGIAADLAQRIVELAQIIKISNQQAALSLANAGVAVSRLKEVFDLCGEHSSFFAAFCEQTFNFSRATTYRYVKIGNVLRQHFVTEDGELLPQAHNVQLSVFRMLGDETDPSVIDQVKLLAGQGEVKKSDIDEILRGMRNDLTQRSDQILEAQGTIANQEAQLVELNRMLETEKARADRNELHERETAATVSRLEDTIRAQELDLQQMQQQLANAQAVSAEVRYEPKEVPPEGYTSAVQAIADKETELIATRERLAQARSELEQIDREIAEARESQRTLDALQGIVQEITGKFPLDVVSKAAALSDAARTAVKSTGENLLALANILMKAGEAHA